MDSHDNSDKEVDERDVEQPASEDGYFVPEWSFADLSPDIASAWTSAGINPYAPVFTAEDIEKMRGFTDEDIEVSPARVVFSNGQIAFQGDTRYPWSALISLIPVPLIFLGIIAVFAFSEVMVAVETLNVLIWTAPAVATAIMFSEDLLKRRGKRILRELEKSAPGSPWGMLPEFTKEQKEEVEKLSWIHCDFAHGQDNVQEVLEEVIALAREVSASSAWDAKGAAQHELRTVVQEIVVQLRDTARAYESLDELRESMTENEFEQRARGIDAVLSAISARVAPIRKLLVDVKSRERELKRMQDQPKVRALDNDVLSLASRAELSVPDLLLSQGLNFRE